MKAISKPEWLKRKITATADLGNVRNAIRDADLHTVCREARCPNRNLCYGKGQATFLIMGDVCTRNCSFCAISHGVPSPLDPGEPRRVAEAAKRMSLEYVVVTSVTRDDLADGGAAHFAATIRQLREILPDAGIEVLTPDFRGDFAALQTVLNEKPDVFNHNVETIPLLYDKVRPQADFSRSLAMLDYAARNSGCIVKSGFMVGLGETTEDIFALMASLRASGVNVVTIGQYLQPTRAHLPVARYLSPSEFDELARLGQSEFGFKKVFAAPLVRSSFMARDLWQGTK